MGGFHLPLAVLVLVAISFVSNGARAFASDDDPIQRVMAAGQQAMLERHYRQAIHIFRNGLKAHPEDNRLRLELGRAYLSSGADSRAMRLFREILRTEPENRLAKLELAGALSYNRRYEDSDRIYKDLLNVNAADEAAAIGLASNLLHQRRSPEAQDVVDRALTFHPNSLRLQEYKDRIASGHLGGEERVQVIARNLVESSVDYLRDSAGNHSWRSTQEADLLIGPGLTNRVTLEQQFLHGPTVVVPETPAATGQDQSQSQALSEVVQTFADELRWKPAHWLFLSAGGGAVQFDSGNVHGVYNANLAFAPREHLVLGISFSRVPITPDAEAAEHRLTAQGWEALASWTPGRWQLNTRWSRQDYSDNNTGSRESAELIRSWGSTRLTLETGYRYRHYSYDHDPADGYFSPDNYQSHLAMAGIRFFSGRRYRGAFQARGGMESLSANSPYNSAWELHARNEVILGNWTLSLDYSKYQVVQSSGAFRADAGRFALTYRF